MADIPIHRWAAIKNTSSIPADFADQLDGLPFLLMVMNEDGDCEIGTNAPLPFLGFFQDVLEGHIDDEVRKN